MSPAAYSEREFCDLQIVAHWKETVPNNSRVIKCWN